MLREELDGMNPKLRLVPLAVGRVGNDDIYRIPLTVGNSSNTVASISPHHDASYDFV